MARTATLDQGDHNKLAAGLTKVPRRGALNTARRHLMPGVTTSAVAAALGPDDLIAAW